MKKITPLGLEMLLATHLHDLNFYEHLLSKVTLKKDSEGKVRSNAIDNIKIMLKLAIKTILAKDPNSTLINKYKSALQNLINYGTAISSSNIKQFIHELENSPEKISFETVSGIPSEVFDEPGPAEEKSTRLVPILNIIVNQVVQDFSEESSQN